MPNNTNRRQEYLASARAATGPFVGTMVAETYYGLVQTPKDAYLLIEACRTGILNRVTRRMTDIERTRVIRPGAVFVFEEEESGIRRWTDHIRWSPSRVSGAFLIYSELHAPGERSDSGSIMYKQSFSSTPSPGEKYHMIAYYDKGVLESGTLTTPTSEERFIHLKVPQGGFFVERPDVRPAVARVTQAQPHAAGPSEPTRHSDPSVVPAAPEPTSAHDYRPGEGVYGQPGGGRPAYMGSTPGGTSEGFHSGTTAVLGAPHMPPFPYYDANAGPTGWTTPTGRTYADTTTMAYGGSGFVAPSQPQYPWRQVYPTGLTYASSSGGYSSDADYDGHQATWLTAPGPSSRPFAGHPHPHPVAGGSAPTLARPFSSSTGGGLQHPQALEFEADPEEFVSSDRPPSPNYR